MRYVHDIVGWLRYASNNAIGLADKIPCLRSLFLPILHHNLASYKVSFFHDGSEVAVVRRRTTTANTLWWNDLAILARLLTTPVEWFILPYQCLKHPFLS